MGSNNVKDKMTLFHYIFLLAINLLYACVSIFTKYASQQVFMSWEYMIGVIGAFVVMAIYAVLWQQILKFIDLSVAYMFKGTSIIFIMLLAYLLFGEQITWNNIVGAIIIVGGIVLFANSAEPPIANRQSPIAK